MTGTARRSRRKAGTIPGTRSPEGRFRSTNVCSVIDESLGPFPNPASFLPCAASLPGSSPRTRRTRVRDPDATDQMSHRGPDGAGVFVEGVIGLGHRRLSIIDLGGGAQPFQSEDGRHVPSLQRRSLQFQGGREALESKGRRFRTQRHRSHLQAYQEWGTDCLARFNGMFGFALWDRHAQKHWIVRDRMGVKRSTTGPMASVSPPPRKTARSSPSEWWRGHSTKASSTRISASVTSPSPHPVPGIRKLEPGTFPKCPWTAEADHLLGLCDRGPKEDSPGLREEFFDLLVDCTKACTVSDVPIGVS